MSRDIVKSAYCINKKSFYYHYYYYDKLSQCYIILFGVDKKNNNIDNNI